MTHYQARYQAANLSDEESKASFVVRQKEFHRVVDDIQSTQPGDSMQHYVFVGRRGSGKSTLLRRIQAEVSTKKDLSDRLMVANLSEEQAGIYQLYDLWDYVLRDLGEQGLNITPIDWQDYEDDMKAYTHALFNSLQDCLKQAKKQLIILIDNIDRIFKAIRKGKGGDTSLLREQLMNHNLVRIIGGSTIMSEDYWKYDMPFYDFFNIKRLKPLKIGEIKTLLNHWAEQQELPDIKHLLQKNPGKLQAVRMLTDGTPRTMLLFIDMLINRPNQNGYDYLRKIIDDATPIYQERLDQLSLQQQKVLVELSFFWEAVPVDKLVSVCKMPGKILSAQLNALEKSRLVEKVKGKTKNHSYRLEERFFNLWLLMTQGGPKQKREVKYLTVFLENWYDQNELRSVYQEFMGNLESGTIKADYAASMSKALVHSRHITANERDTLIDKVQGLDLKEEWIRQLPEKTSEIYEKVSHYFENEDFKNAEDVLKKLEQNHVRKWFGLGLACNLQNKIKEAESYYLLAIQHENSGTNEDLGAMNNLAVLYEDQEKWELAEKYYLMAIKQNHSGAMNNIALLYKNQEKWELAEKYYLMAIEQDHSNAMYNLALLYDNQEKWELAEKYYLMAIEQDHSEAMNNIALLYKNQEKWELAEKYYLMAIEQDDSHAMYNLAWQYGEQEKWELAEKYYLMAIEQDDSDAMNNLATLYKNQEKWELAEKYYLMAIEQDHSDAINNLALLYNNQEKWKLAEKYYLMAIEQNHSGAMYNLALLYDNQEKWKLTEKYYLMAIEQNRSDAMNNLALLYDNQEKWKLAEKYYLMAIEQGDSHAMNNFLNLQYERNTVNSTTQRVFDSFRKQQFNRFNHLFLASAISLWLGKLESFNQFKTEIQAFLKSENSEEEIDLLSLLLQRWLVHKQPYSVYTLFNEYPNIKEQMLPVYYASLHFVEGQEQALKSMPPELEENVQDILDQIRKKQAFYYDKTSLTSN